MLTFNSLSFCGSRRRNYFEFRDREEAILFAELLDGQVSQNNKGTWSVNLLFLEVPGRREEGIVRNGWHVFCPLFSAYADVNERSNYFVLINRQRETS